LAKRGFVWASLPLLRDRLLRQLAQDGQLVDFVVRGLDDHQDPGAEYGHLHERREDLVYVRTTPVAGNVKHRAEHPTSMAS
jgi:hypothetical protein